MKAPAQIEAMRVPLSDAHGVHGHQVCVNLFPAKGIDQEIREISVLERLARIR